MDISILLDPSAWLYADAILPAIVLDCIGGTVALCYGAVSLYRACLRAARAHGERLAMERAFDTAARFVALRAALGLD